jgi:hypothetical protein
MNISSELAGLVTQAVKTRGLDTVRKALTVLVAEDRASERVLTILGNEGIHNVPEEQIHGELYVATKGTLDLSQHDSVEDLYVSILRPLAKKLHEKSWQKVYLIPTGPTTLVLQIKLLVYHITRKAPASTVWTCC